MMARRGVLGMLVGGAVALLSACNPFGGNGYRFRMTVEVETPEGLKTGSSVYEVRAEKDIKLSPDMGNAHTSIRGEAIAVDLPRGKTLFALLKTVAGDDLPYMSMKTLDPAYNNKSVESAQRIASGNGIRSPADIAEGDYPMLVTFTDIDDPKSVQRVDPANLAASFGPGIRLKRITVEVTDDDVTTGIEKRLPHFGKASGFLAWQQTLANDDPRRRLARNDFISGDGK
jgi:hypothetical protein